MHRCLNLGCGRNVLEGYENYDLYPVDARVIKLDISQLPLPFEDRYADEILLSHVLEHLNINHLDFIMECYRILKPRGRLHIALPVRDGGIEHIREVFDKDYFQCLFVSSEGKGSSQTCFNLFALIGFRKKYNSLSTFFWKIRHWVESFFYSEYEWELRKK